MPEQTPRTLGQIIAAASRVFASPRPSPGAVLLRTASCLAALLAIAAYVGETGNTAYTALNYPVLIYAGLSLPWTAVVGLTAIAAVGPNPNGSVFVTGFEEDSADIIRPVALAIVAATSLALARSHRSSEDTLRANERRLSSFLEGIPIGVLILSAEGKVSHSNHSAERLQGHKIEPGMRAGDIAAAQNGFIAGTNDPYPMSRRPYLRALAGETSVIDDLEIQRTDGRINLQVWGAPIYNEAGRIIDAVVAFSNITAQKSFERALIASEARFRTVFEEGPLGMAIVGPDQRFIQVNQALCDITGFRGDELANRSFADITHADDLDLEAVRAFQRGEMELLDVELRYIRKDGEPVWCRVCVRVVRNGNGDAAYQLFMVQDISERRRAQALIEHMAYADPLTDLPNRRLLYDRVSQAIARARRQNGSVVVLSIDMDGFSSINDRYGHEAGDAVLIEMGRRLSNALRETDTVARTGGDEFVVLLSDASGSDADHVRRRIESALAAPVTLTAGTLRVSVSIGRADLQTDGETADALINAAGAAMHRAKGSRQPAR